MTAPTIHKGQMLRHKTELSWPAVIVSSVHTDDLPSIAGRVLPAFAWVTWQDDNSHTTINLSTLQRDWEDTGV